MLIGNGQFLLGDCLDRMSEIPDGSVDMVLCDLPYGTTACKWDQVIPFEPLWSHYWRVCKSNAAIVLTASQPFTSALVMSQIDRFAYQWTWRKSRPGGIFNKAIRPLKVCEQINVFQVCQSVYNPQNLIPFNKRIRNNARKIDSSVGARSCRIEGSTYEQEFTGYPFDLIECATDGKSFHPTQKPVALFDYLIRTYTNPGDLVLDNCAGSGTTAVAAQLSGRRWLCIERDPAYYYAAVGRAWKACQP